MSKQTTKRTAAKHRPQARKGRTVVAARSAGRRTDRTSWIIAAIVIVVGGALVFVFASGSKHTSNGGPITGREKASASLVSKITTVPDSVIAKVGKGTVTGLPGKLPGPLLKTADGKPRVIYLGAEYCPFCATERWAMVNAFSRFGTFTNLQITTSAVAPETDPSTPTWSFHGATYKSNYIQFEPVEQEDNTEKPLETPTAEQSQLLATYDVPKYTNGGEADAIPFIDFGNEYVISGATYSPDVLQGKTHDEIATALSQPTSAISKGAIGAANAITAAVCKLTNDKPATACTAPIKAIESQLPS